VLKSFVNYVLGKSTIDANAILDLHKTFIFEPEVLGTMLGGVKKLRLLDVGSGDGGVICDLAAMFEHVTATEASEACFNRLKSKKFVHEALYCNTLRGLHSKRFDVVSLLNVLDRCRAPIELLNEAVKLTNSEGRLLIALVYPYTPFVTEGDFHGSQLNESQQLPLLRCSSFEEFCNRAAKEVFAPLNLSVEFLTRTPYMCVAYENPYVPPYSCLDNAVFVLKHSVRGRE
jgi:SAM-dependent methyltransferase